MSDVSPKRPVLVLPHSALSGDTVLLPRTPAFLGQIPAAPTPWVPQHSSFTAHPFTIGQWLQIATQRPSLIKDLMLFPQSPRVLQAIWEERRDRQLPLFDDPSQRFLSGANMLVLSGANETELAAVLQQEFDSDQVSARIFFNPATDAYRVEFYRRPAADSAAQQEPEQQVVAGGWVLSTVSHLAPEVREVITDASTIQSVMQGTRILLLSGESQLHHPSHVVLTDPQPDRRAQEFWVPQPGQVRPHGSSTGLRIDEVSMERLNVVDLFNALERAAMKARQAGRVPVVASDLDGTLFKARAFVQQLFLEWLDGNPTLNFPPYDGPRAEEVREKTASATVNKPNLLRGWNSRSVLRDLDILDERVVRAAQRDLGDAFANSTRESFLAWAKEYDGLRAENIRIRIRDALVNPKRARILDQQNTRAILRDLSILDERVSVSAMAHFNEHFYSADRRIDAPVIEGMVELVKLLQERDFQMVYVTLRKRGDREDLIRSGPEQGRSAAQVGLERAGIFREGVDVLLRHEGEALDWSEEAYLAGANEPEKWKMTRDWMGANPKAHIVGILENAPAHLQGYRKAFPYDIVIVHVQGDDPPNSPQLPDGVFSVDPQKLGEEFQQVAVGGMLAPQQGLSALDGPAWETLLANYNHARMMGQEPVVFLDLDDTLVQTSTRTRSVLRQFLEEWVADHPEGAWAIDSVGEITPSQIEYGIEATLEAAGLEHLGIAGEFKSYFLRHFLSDDYLDQDQVRAGAVDFVHTLLNMGVRVVYLTGRVHSDMERGTRASLERFGFPLDHPQVSLAMREDASEPDEVFKARVQSELAGSGMVIAAFDNEPGNLVNFERSFPHAAIYQVGNRHTPNAPEPPASVIPIADFKGAVGMPPPRAGATVGEGMRQRGRESADDLMKQLGVVRTALTSVHYLDKREFFDDRIDEAVDRAKGILDDILWLPVSHPTRHAFYAKLNDIAGKRPGGVESFEDALNSVSGRSGQPFVVVRGPEGIADILRSNEGVLERPVSLPPPRIQFVSPSMLEEAQLRSTGALTSENVAGILPSIPSGPEISNGGIEGLYDALSFSRYPRMDFLFNWLIGSMLLAGRERESIQVVEHGPRRAIGPLLSLAQTGVQVGWRETVEPQRIQTELELQRLPQELRDRIEYLPNDVERPADIVVWNFPPAQLSLDRVGEGLAASRFAGFADKEQPPSGYAIVQSEQRWRQYSQLTSEERARWELIMQSDVTSDDYVLPSAFLYLQGQGIPNPMLFQVLRPRAAVAR